MALTSLKKSLVQPRLCNSYIAFITSPCGPIHSMPQPNRIRTLYHRQSSFRTIPSQKTAANHYNTLFLWLKAIGQVSLKECYAPGPGSRQNSVTQHAAASETERGADLQSRRSRKGLQEDAQGRGTALHHHQVHYSRCMSVPIATARPPRLLGTTSCLLPAKHAALFPHAFIDCMG